MIKTKIYVLKSDYSKPKAEKYFLHTDLLVSYTNGDILKIVPKLSNY